MVVYQSVVGPQRHLRNLTMVHSPWVYPILLLLFSSGRDGFALIHLYSLLGSLEINDRKEIPFVENPVCTSSLAQQPSGCLVMVAKTT